MVMNSLIFAWAYQAMGLQGLSNAIGVIEVAIGLLIAARLFWPQASASASAIGSLGAAILFLVTLSFMVSTPGVWEPGYGFPARSGMPGQFLAEDLVLLGVSL